MLEEYDIDNFDPRPNTYAKELNKQGNLAKEEHIMEVADNAAASTSKRLTHEEVFGSIREKIDNTSQKGKI